MSVEHCSMLGIQGLVANSGCKRLSQRGEDCSAGAHSRGEVMKPQDRRKRQGGVFKKEKEHGIRVIKASELPQTAF